MLQEEIKKVGITEIEQFIYAEAALLDEWRLDEWLELFTEEAVYFVPANNRPDGDPKNELSLIYDDIRRIKARVKRLNSRNAHAEYPKSRTSRLISNVRITDADEDSVTVTSKFIVHRFRRNFPERVYVGKYEHRLILREGLLKIAERKAILVSDELGDMGSISILL